MKKITYLFGAGASYYACPILNEQGNKMMELSNKLGYNFNFPIEKETFADDKERLVWEIGHVGFKSKEFNTVDTYARKLYLQKELDDLNVLKRAVSSFFTLWLLTKDNWKNLDKSKNDQKNRNFPIDPRYINLLATYLTERDTCPKLRDNVSFITWNYDLQIESAYRKFTNIDDFNFNEINNWFHFIPNNHERLDVCHLNGFHGYFGFEDKNNLFKKYENCSLANILNEGSFISNYKKFRTQKNTDFISYAWEEESEMSKKAREQAIQIMTETEILVIIGYSFPPFNHEIDKMMFESATNLEKVIIQNPSSDANFLEETFGFSKSIIKVVNDVDQFVIPNYKEYPPTNPTVFF